MNTPLLMPGHSLVSMDAARRTSLRFSANEPTDPPVPPQNDDVSKDKPQAEPSQSFWSGLTGKAREFANTAAAMGSQALNTLNQTLGVSGRKDPESEAPATVAEGSEEKPAQKPSEEVQTQSGQDWLGTLTGSVGTLAEQLKDHATKVSTDPVQAAKDVGNQLLGTASQTGQVVHENVVKPVVERTSAGVENAKDQAAEDSKNLVKSLPEIVIAGPFKPLGLLLAAKNYSGTVGKFLQGVWDPKSVKKDVEVPTSDADASKTSETPTAPAGEGPSKEDK